MRRVACAVAAAAAIGSAACAPAIVKLPSGPGAPVASADAEAALDQATASCRTIRTLTAEIAVSGTAGGQRLRVRLTAGVAAPASARLEAAAPFGAPFFIFVATDGDATLVLPRDRRVLEHGRPDAVLDAVAGVPLDAADLDRALTGCLAPARLDAGEAVQLGDRWRRITSGSGEETYLQRTNASAPWRVAAAIRRTWRVDYLDVQGGLPRTIRLTSAGPGAPGAAFNLELVLSQVETNVPLGADAFRVKIPTDAAPISLDELRRARPARQGVRED